MLLTNIPSVVQTEGSSPLGVEGRELPPVEFSFKERAACKQIRLYNTESVKGK
jgi:hypothetical protein